MVESYESVPTSVFVRKAINLSSKAVNLSSKAVNLSSKAVNLSPPPFLSE